MTVHHGWQRRFFKDFVVGDVSEHPLGRPVTTTDNIWFTLLTQNTAPLHFDHEYAKATEFGKPLLNSAFTLSLVVGLDVTDVSQNVFANLFEGDTLRSRSRVLEARESASRPSLGVVTVETEGLNQTGDVVVEFTRTLLAYKRGQGPRAGATTGLTASA